MKSLQALIKLFSEDVGNGKRINSAKDLAGMCGVSESYLSRNFGKEIPQEKNLGRFFCVLDALGYTITTDAESAKIREDERLAAALKDAEYWRISFEALQRVFASTIRSVSSRSSC